MRKYYIVIIAIILLCGCNTATNDINSSDEINAQEKENENRRGCQNIS